MVKAEYIVYVCMYIHSSCIWYNNTVNHLKVYQQLSRLALRVNLWLWNWTLTRS